MSDKRDDSASIVEFGAAKAPHEYARKERRLEGLRARFNAVLKAARPKAARAEDPKGKKKRKKNKTGKRPKGKS